METTILNLNHLNVRSISSNHGNSADDQIRFSQPFVVATPAGGNVGIGTSSPTKKLTVAGNVLAEEVVVKPQSEWADFVFEEDYDLPPLEEVSAFIDDEGRLPEVPSAQAVKENGVRMGEMDATLLQKVEELTLYAVEQNRRADSLSREVSRLRTQLMQQVQANKSGQTQLHRQQREIEVLREKVDQLDQRLSTPAEPGEGQ